MLYLLTFWISTYSIYFPSIGSETIVALYFVARALIALKEVLSVSMPWVRLLVVIENSNDI